MKRALTALAVLAFAGFLLYLSLSARRHGVEVCLTFEGRRGCGSAWASSRAQALRAAANNACGTLARGMEETMRCGQTKPDEVRRLGEGAPAEGGRGRP